LKTPYGITIGASRDAPGSGVRDGLDLLMAVFDRLTQRWKWKGHIDRGSLPHLTRRLEDWELREEESVTTHDLKQLDSGLKLIKLGIRTNVPSPVPPASPSSAAHQVIPSSPPAAGTDATPVARGTLALTPEPIYSPAGRNNLRRIDLIDENKDHAIKIDDTKYKLTEEQYTYFKMILLSGEDHVSGNMAKDHESGLLVSHPERILDALKKILPTDLFETSRKGTRIAKTYRA
jgi:hypothetical protein